MRLLHWIILFALCVVFVSPAIAQESNKMELVGSAKLKYFLWDVYEAELFAVNGDYKQQGDFELRLTYLMDLDGEKIAKRSIKEMRQLGAKNPEQLKTWLGFLTKTIPDVSEGSVLRGIKAADGTVQFASGSKPLGEIKDNDFAFYFFGIWLDPKTSEPKLREQLLGLKK